MTVEGVLWVDGKRRLLKVYGSFAYASKRGGLNLHLVLDDNCDSLKCHNMPSCQYPEDEEDGWSFDGPRLSSDH